MPEEKFEDRALDPLSELIDKLSSEQQEDLRRRLNRMAWERRFKQIYNIVEAEKQGADQTIRDSLATRIAMSIQAFIDQVEAGDFDRTLAQGIKETWVQGLQTINSLPSSDAVESKNRESLLEGAYEELQSQLIQVRQAVAQAIATEKQLENQFTKARDQAQTWQNRALQATEQGNSDLSKQAQAREKQYHDAAIELESRVKSQRAATDTLRQLLTKVEGEVQKVYVKKQVLLARDKAATATITAKKIMSEFDCSEMTGELEHMEQLVLAKEQQAGGALPDLENFPGTINTSELLTRFNASVERFTAIVERVENQLMEQEKLAEPE